MMLKILLVIGIVALVYFIYKKSKANKKNLKKDDEKSLNEMVECATCGIYFEMSDAILSANRYYCSKECLERKK